MNTLPSIPQRFPLFTIIIPTHNSEKTIINCLESLASQTLPDFEVIVQDGLSSDNTIPMIYNFSCQYLSLLVRVFEEKDLGVYDAMNRALHHAKGLWVYFLGSDDQLYEATTLESVANSIKDDVDVIYGDVYSKYLGGRYAGRFSPNKLLAQNICHQSIFIRNSTFNRLGNFSLSFKIAADWEHNMRWFLDPTIKVLYIDRVIAIFADGGLSSNADLYFDSQKPFLYAFHGRKTVPIYIKLSLVFKKLLYAIRRRNLLDIKTAFSLFCYLLIPPTCLSR